MLAKCNAPCADQLGFLDDAEGQMLARVRVEISYLQPVTLILVQLGPLVRPHIALL